MTIWKPNEILGCLKESVIFKRECGRLKNVPPPPKKIHIFIPQTCVILGWGRGELLQRGGSFQVWINWGFFFFKDFIYLFLERGREGEREGEKHQCVVASHTPPTGGLAHNLDKCPHWELNQRPLGLQAGTQSTEPHQPGLNWGSWNWEVILNYVSGP